MPKITIGLLRGTTPPQRDLAFRKVEQDIEVGGKLLRGGNFAIVPVCQLHDNVDVFGTDASSFQPDRFLKRQDLTGSPSYRPYGGGKTYCPGRFFAMHEIFGFVALLIHRLDVQLASPGQCFPIPDEGLPTLGISRPVPGSDLWITLSDKSHSMQRPRHFSEPNSERRQRGVIHSCNIGKSM